GRAEAEFVADLHRETAHEEDRNRTGDGGAERAGDGTYGRYGICAGGGGCGGGDLRLGHQSESMPAPGGVGTVSVNDHTSRRDRSWSTRFRHSVRGRLFIWCKSPASEV